jgi:hypothetical protein
MRSRAVTAEEALRVQAVEGLEQLAAARVPDALEALTGATDAASLTVRAISLSALQHVEGGAEARAGALTRLAPEHRSLADLRRVDVREVAQIVDPRRHLAGEVRREPAVPRLDSAEPWPTQGKQTPRVREARSDG